MVVEDVDIIRSRRVRLLGLSPLPPLDDATNDANVNALSTSLSDSYAALTCSGIFWLTIGSIKPSSASGIPLPPFRCVICLNTETPPIIANNKQQMTANAITPGRTVWWARGSMESLLLLLLLLALELELELEPELPFKASVLLLPLNTMPPPLPTVLSVVGSPPECTIAFDGDAAVVLLPPV